MLQYKKTERADTGLLVAVNSLKFHPSFWGALFTNVNVGKVFEYAAEHTINSTRTLEVAMLEYGIGRFCAEHGKDKLKSIDMQWKQINQHRGIRLGLTLFAEEGGADIIMLDFILSGGEIEGTLRHNTDLVLKFGESSRIGGYIAPRELYGADEMGEYEHTYTMVDPSLHLLHTKMGEDTSATAIIRTDDRKEELFNSFMSRDVEQYPWIDNPSSIFVIDEIMPLNRPARLVSSIGITEVTVKIKGSNMVFTESRIDFGTGDRTYGTTVQTSGRELDLIYGDYIINSQDRLQLTLK